ncbi:MAG: Fic family protein [Methanomassiliicoccaceae archaeon]|nr:Fic family protein [Methanomassiliicoccaceae archaeon]
MRRFDYSFIKGLRISTGVLSLTNKIEILRSKEDERKKNNADIFSALASVARVMSVKGSNEIEGIVTTDKRMAEIVNGNSAPVSHDEKEISGYRDALDMIRDHHASIAMREDLILDLHRIMMSYTEEGGGKYKGTDNLIISTDRNGMRRIVFEPVSFEDTPAAMEQLILAYTDAAQDSGINRMILIPCFILDLLCVHPFTDGNGRISRLLSLLLMFNNGMDVGKYISFEEEINRSKGRYYEALRRSSENWHTNGNDYVPFIENFFFVLSSCYKELDERFMVIGNKKINKANRIEATILNSIVPISKKEIMELLPDVSVTTIEAKISELLKDEKIRKVGTYRDARYVRR